MSPVESDRNGGAGDASLVQAYVASRGPDNLRVLVDRHSRMVRGVCRLYLRAAPELADDAARVVFLVLARDAVALAKHKQLLLAGWLHGVAILAASSVRALNQRTVEGDGGSVGEGLSDAGRETLHEAIRSLPTRHREALLLGSLCGVSDDEMSRRLEAPQSEAHSLLDNGRMKLSRQLEAAGMDATEASVAGWLDDEAKAIAGSAGQEGGRPLVDWTKCSADQPLGKVSQTVLETADHVTAQMARSAAGRKVGLTAAVAAVAAIGAVVAILAVRPASDKSQGTATVVMQVASVSGVASVAGADQQDKPLKAGDSVPADARFRTEKNADLTLTHTNGLRIVLRDDTEVTFEKSERGPAVRLARGGLIAEAKGRLTLRTDHVVAVSEDGRLTMLLGKAGKPFTRVDVAAGTVSCTREGGAGTESAPVSLKSGFMACFGEGLKTRAQESDGQEFALAGGGVFLRSVINDYDMTGLRLDQPKCAHMTGMWRQSGYGMETYFSGGKTSDAELAKDESGTSCWAIRVGKGRDTTEESIPIRAEGDVPWVAIRFAVKPGSGPVGVGLAGEDFVPDALPGGVKQKVAETAGAQSKIEPLTMTTWTLKWALVGAMPDGLPLYEYESRIGNGPAVKGWRAGTLEKIRIRFSGAEFRIYEIKGGSLEKVPVREAQR